MPRFNPNNDYSIGKLREAMEYSSERLRVFRENRKDMIDAYTGGSYGDGGESGEVIVNMMELGINIYQRHLASHNPQVIVDSPIRQLGPVAGELTIAMNHLTKQMALGEALNDTVYDALFAMGIMKVGITPKEHDDLEGFRHDSGQPFADPIDLADWVHDMNARRFEQIDFCGNLYRVPYDDVMQSPLFNNGGKRELYAYMRQNYSGHTLRGDWERVETLTQGSSPMPVEYRDHIELWDVWMPADRLLVTLHADGQGRPLRVVDWDGPEHGPYQLLGLGGKVPSNVMPLAPAMIWEDINDLINRLSTKAGMQADRQKVVLAGMNRTASTMEAIINTADGQSLVTEVDPNQIKEFVFGGVDPSLMGAMGTFKDLFVYLAGNLDALGGLGPQSQTVGQDRLLSASASQRLNDMQDRVVKFTTAIVEDLAWYLWRDPFIDLPLTKNITPGIQRDFRWTSDSREGDYFQYNFRVVPHSLQARSPQERLQTLLQLVNTVIIPMMPMLQQQGVMFDAEAFLKMVAKLSNSPELEKILIRDTGQSLLGQQSPIDPKQSPVTTRNQVRMDRGGDKRETPGADAFQQNGGPRGNYKQGTMG